MFIRPGKNGKAEIVLLDHGLYDHLKPNDREHLCSLYKSIVMSNEDDMEKYSHLLGVKGNSTLTALFYILHFLQKKRELFQLKT